MPGTLILDTNTMAPFEIGARLDALLCYSTWSTARQQGFADAICADLLAFSVQLEPDRSLELYKAWPQYRKGRNRASLAALHNRRDEALKVGLAFLPALKQPPLASFRFCTGSAAHFQPRRLHASFGRPERMVTRLITKAGCTTI